jgi:hypothetical protein
LSSSSLTEVKSSSLDHFRVEGQTDRRFTFDEKDSLALKAIEQGTVDFADKRVEFTAAKVELTAQRQDLIEVDLGNLRSLPQDQIHVSENRTATKGENLVDTDDNEYKLVMVGRKLRPDETPAVLAEGGQ